MGEFGSDLGAPGLRGLQGTSEATLFQVLVEGFVCEDLGVLSQTLPHVDKLRSESLGLLLGLTPMSSAQDSFCLGYPNVDSLTW